MAKKAVKQADEKHKAPSFQFYPGDWLSSTKIAMMTPAQEGAYIRLLCHDWANDGLPDDDDALAMLSRAGEEWHKGSYSLVKKCFTPHPRIEGLITNKRLEEEREKQATWRAKCSQGGQKASKKRWEEAKKGENHKGSYNLVTPLVTDYLQVKDNYLVTKGISKGISKPQLKDNTSSSTSSSTSLSDPIGSHIPVIPPDISNCSIKNTHKPQPTEVAPIHSDKVHFRITSQELATCHKWADENKLGADYVELAINEVDDWMQSESKSARDARKSPTHKRYVSQSWVQSKVAERRRATAMLQRPPDAPRFQKAKTIQEKNDEFFEKYERENGLRPEPRQMVDVGGNADEPEILFNDDEWRNENE